MESKEALNGIKVRISYLKDNHKIGSRSIANQEISEIAEALDYFIKPIEKDLEEKEYTDRKNADLLETIECIKQHAFIRKNSKIGTEIIITLHSNDKDFKKVSWVFDIIK